MKWRLGQRRYLAILLMATAGQTISRAAFIDKISAPVANKMFECGTFP
jgi:hypothetical protein